MHSEKVFLKTISLAVILVFLCNNLTWAGVGPDQYKLAVPGGQAGVLARAPEAREVAEIARVEQILKRLQINNLQSLIANIRPLKEAGAVSFVYTDRKGQKAVYIFRKNYFIRQVKPDVDDKFYRLLRKIGIAHIGLKEREAEQELGEKIRVTDGNAWIINSILQSISGNDPAWVVEPAPAKSAAEKSGLPQRGASLTGSLYVLFMTALMVLVIFALKEHILAWVASNPITFTFVLMLMPLIFTYLIWRLVFPARYLLYRRINRFKTFWNNAYMELYVSEKSLGDLLTLIHAIRNKRRYVRGMASGLLLAVLKDGDNRAEVICEREFGENYKKVLHAYYFTCNRPADEWEMNLREDGEYAVPALSAIVTNDKDESLRIEAKKILAKSNDAQSHLQQKTDGPESQPIITMSVDNKGEIGKVEVTGGVEKLLRIVQAPGCDEITREALAGHVKDRLQKILFEIKLRDKYGEGIFGAVKQIVLVDNLGGIFSSHEKVRGPVSVLRNGTILIDIDAFYYENLGVLKEVVLHELWHSVLEKVESSEGINEVTAIYRSLLGARSEEGKTELLTAVLGKSDNGLDSASYAHLLNIASTGELNDDDLIILAIGYVMKEPRYARLRKDLEDAGTKDIKHAIEKLDLALEIYHDIAKAKTAIASAVAVWSPVVNRVKTAEAKSKAFMKAKMVFSWARGNEVGFVNELIRGGVFIKLDVNELRNDPPSGKWLWNLLNKENFKDERKSPFILYSSNESEYTVANFLSDIKLEEDKFTSLTYLGEQKIPKEKIIDIKNIALVTELPQGTLSLPLFYSVTSIYLASRIVLEGGDISKLDNLTYTTLMNIYKAIYGDDFTEEMLKQMIIGTLPPMTRLTEVFDILRNAVFEMENDA